MSTPPVRRGRRRWLLLAGGAVAATVVVVAASSLGRGPDIPARSVADIAYTDKANAACKQVLPALRGARPQLGEKPEDPAEVVAGKVRRTADGLEKLVAELRALPVGTADRPRVERWLADWDAFIALGRRYVTELDRGDNDAPARVAEEADPLTRRIFLFARANGMSECLL